MCDDQCQNVGFDFRPYRNLRGLVIRHVQHADKFRPCSTGDVLSTHASFRLLPLLAGYAEFTRDRVRAHDDYSQRFCASGLMMMIIGESKTTRETTKKSPGNEIAKTIILTCDVARSFPSRVHVTLYPDGCRDSDVWMFADHER